MALAASRLMSVVDLLRLPVRHLRAWANRHNGRLVADLERRYNLNQLQRFEAVLNRHGRSFRTSSSILEFGCGDGRLTQHLLELAPKACVCGCDIRSDAIAACRRKYPQGRFLVNRPAPPLEVDDAAFDLIYSYSVFTHLSEPNHKAWLKELARTLKAGGLMLHTVHSEFYVARAAMFSPDSLRRYRFPDSPEAFIRSGRDYLYVVEDPAIPEYGYTIIRKAYVAASWPRLTGLTLLDYVEGAIESYPEGCQDMVLLAKQVV